MVTTALTTARRGKLEEIEKELEMLEKYKEQMPEEEYNEKVTVLMAALPKPTTYDMYTKVDDLVTIEDDEPEEVEDEVVGEEVEVDLEGGEEDKQSPFAATTGAVSRAAKATAGAIKRPFTKKPNADPYDEVPDDA